VRVGFYNKLFKKKNKKNVSESILEKALLEAEQLEETMKSNAKEILSSTMKEEIQELVKESLNEDDYLKEQEEEEVDIIDVDEMEGGEPEMDLDMLDSMELDIEDETDDLELPELPPLDLTLASDEEVLKVFKAMGDQDGIIIQKDDEEIALTDTTNNTEYIIKLDEEKKSKTMKKSANETKEVSEMKDMDEMDMDEMHHETEEGYMDETEDEVVYEIELSEDYEEEDHEDRDDFDGSDSEVVGVDSDINKQRMGEESDMDLGPEDEMGEGEHEMEEGDYGLKNHKGHSNQGYLDREADMLGGEHGHEDDKMSLKTRARMARGTRKYDTTEASRTLGLGRESGGKHKPSGIRKAITPNRNLGESRVRKSYNLLKEEVETLKVKNSDYRKALTTFKDKLNEVGVFNSNLAYVTRLFTEHSTTKQEKIKVLRRFDGVNTLKGSKSLYKVIKEELTREVVNPTKTIAESVENKITKSPTSGGGRLLESKVYENPQFSRMKDLMSKL
jgi:hypothetical protein